MMYNNKRRGMNVKIVTDVTPFQTHVFAVYHRRYHCHYYDYFYYKA